MEEVEFHPGDEQGELSPEALEEVRSGSYKQESDNLLEQVDEITQDTAFYMNDDILNTALVAANEKEGMMLRATLPDTQPLERQIDAMNDLGMDCYVIPETIEVEGEEMDNSAVYATKNREYRDLTEEELPFTVGSHEDDEGLGEFFGYPEEETESYVEHGMWPNGFTYEDWEGRPMDYEPGKEHVFPPQMLARMRGEDEETAEKVHSLINYAIQDTPESLENAVEKAERRYRTLEQLEEDYGVNFTELVT